MGFFTFVTVGFALVRTTVRRRATQHPVAGGSISAFHLRKQGLQICLRGWRALLLANNQYQASIGRQGIRAVGKHLIDEFLSGANRRIGNNPVKPFVLQGGKPIAHKYFSGYAVRLRICGRKGDRPLIDIRHELQLFKCKGSGKARPARG